MRVMAHILTAYQMIAAPTTAINAISQVKGLFRRLIEAQALAGI